jgi:hypothetical protein
MRTFVRRSLILFAVALGATAAVRCGSITVEDVDAATGDAGATDGAGDGPVDCAQLEHDYASALIDAKVCTAASTACQKPVLDKLACGCTTYVDQVDRLAAIRKTWTDGGCTAGICPAIACTVATTGACQVASGATTGMCQDKL